MNTIIMPRIDLVVPLFVPPGWEIYSHRTTVNGKDHFIWNPTEIRLTADGVAPGKIEHGRKMLEQASRKEVLNANPLDFSLQNRELIPKCWKEEPNGIFYWGTVYLKPDGYLAVRCQIFRESWTWDHCYFE